MSQVRVQGVGGVARWRSMVPAMTSATEIDPENPIRTEAAAELRRLIHAFVGHDADDGSLAEVGRRAGELADQLSGAARRERSPDMMKRFSVPVPDQGELTCWQDCVVAGHGHPYGTGFSGRREGDEVVAWVTLGAGHEGAPGRSHGGIIAALFDEAMGFALWMEGVPAYTAWLKTTFVAPAPIGTELEFRAHVTSRERRKIFLEATATDAGREVGRAEGLFIAIPEDQI